MTHVMRRFFGVFGVFGVLALSLACSGCGSERPSPLVVLIAVDGATPEHINELRARGQLPNIDRLIREGSWGPMESLAARRRLRPKPRRGYWSPIVWASMATGKIPDKHGIVDFLLPLPGTSFAWAGQNDGPPFAEIRLPEISGASPHTLKVRLRNYAPNGAQNVELTMNGQTLGSVELTADWKDETLAIPHDALRPAENRLTFAFERQSRPADHGPSKDQRSLAGAVAPFSILDSAGEVVVRFDPIYGRFELIHGFHQPEAKVVEAQSTHMRAMPVWDLLGDAGHPVGIVGYWTTWPAYPVNGFLVSSHFGVRGKRQKTSTALTWPPELTGEIEALEPDDAAIAQMTAELYPQTCRPLTPKELRSFERILWQDAFYQRIARKLLPTMDRGFFTVYFESIDASGHLFLPFRHGKAIPPGCPDTVRDVVDKTYLQIDRFVGELLAVLPDRATVMLVSDHGSSSGGDRGFHAPFGVFAARGPGIRAGGEVRGTMVLDVAPTILYALGEGVPLDMDGKVAVSSFEAGWLETHPVAYLETDTSMTPEAATEGEISEEMLERLRSLGYVR